LSSKYEALSSNPVPPEEKVPGMMAGTIRNIKGIRDTTYLEGIAI
jgi:hypothetical protein